MIPLIAIVGYIKLQLRYKLIENLLDKTEKDDAVLMERKLEAIRGTLQSLRLEDPSSSVEVYDRLGHISRFSRNTGYSDA